MLRRVFCHVASLDTVGHVPGVPDVSIRQSVLLLLLLPEWLARHDPPQSLRRKAYVSRLLNTCARAAGIGHRVRGTSELGGQHAGELGTVSSADGDSVLASESNTRDEQLGGQVDGTRAPEFDDADVSTLTSTRDQPWQLAGRGAKAAASGACESTGCDATRHVAVHVYGHVMLKLCCRGDHSLVADHLLTCA